MLISCQTFAFLLLNIRPQQKIKLKKKILNFIIDKQTLLKNEIQHKKTTTTSEHL